MKKSTPKKPKKKISDASFTRRDADHYFGVLQEDSARYYGSLKEHFDDKFKVIHERIDLMDEKFEQKFSDVHGILKEHSQMLGRLMIDVEEIKSGMREKVSVKEFNKLESRPQKSPYALYRG